MQYLMAADYAFYLKAYILGKKFSYISQDLVHFQLDGLTGLNMDKYILEMKEVWKHTVPGFVEILRKENNEHTKLMQHKIMLIAEKINRKYQTFRRSLKS